MTSDNQNHSQALRLAIVTIALVSGVAGTAQALPDDPVGATVAPGPLCYEVLAPQRCATLGSAVMKVYELIFGP